jgi:hypothetical protein
MCVSRFAAPVAATLMLLAPAVWNGFPLLQYDTGGYLARWFEGYLVPSRSTVYGLFLLLGAHPAFWPAVIVPAALTVWVLALVLRAHGLGGRPVVLVGFTALLCLGTTLPFLTSILLTDIFASLAVLALHLLVCADNELRRFERAALVTPIGFAAATHSATFAVLLALVAAGALARFAFRTGSAAGLVRGAVALALGALMLLTANLVVAGRFAWTPGGLALSFGRMLQDGVVERYLAEHCPNPRLRLCSHRAKLPTDADVFFWSGDGSVFNRLGRFKGLGDEMGAIVGDSLREYPLLQLELAARATVRQLLRVHTGEGAANTIWHTYAIIRQFEPSVVADMQAAHQQHGGLSFDAINRIHVPVAFGAMAMLVVALGLGLWRPVFADLSSFAAAAGLALVANAFVCGVLSNPHDRYGARLVWLAPLVVLLALERLRRRIGALLPDGPLQAAALTAPAPAAIASRAPR